MRWGNGVTALVQHSSRDGVSGVLMAVGQKLMRWTANASRSLSLDVRRAVSQLAVKMMEIYEGCCKMGWV